MTINEEIKKMLEEHNTGSSEVIETVEDLESEELEAKETMTVNISEDIGSLSHYKKFVSDKGHLTHTASSVLNDYSKKHKLSNVKHNKLVKDVFSDPDDRFHLLRKESIDISEDVNALLNDEDQLSEEFKTKAATIFETAVVSRVQSEVSKLVEAYAAQLHEEVTQIKEGLADKVDGYLNLVVEQWMDDNEIALTSGVKNEIMENFLSGIKSVFEQNYIEIPEDKFDVLESMEAKVEQLESKLNEATEKNVELFAELVELRKDVIVSEACDGLADTQADKFKSLVEEISYDDEDSFIEKVKTIRENYFKKPSIKQLIRETFIVDEPIEEEEEKEERVNISPAMASYMNAINRNAKF